jgi:hypothetical protein
VKAGALLCQSNRNCSRHFQLQRFRIFSVSAFGTIGSGVQRCSLRTQVTTSHPTELSVREILQWPTFCRHLTSFGGEGTDEHPPVWCHLKPLSIYFNGLEEAQFEPVTPEVAGSSPVGPAKVKTLTSSRKGFLFFGSVFSVGISGTKR